MKFTVKQRQTVFDIALIACGDREAAFEISRLNDISLSDTIEPGTELEIPAVINQKVVNYYEVNGIEPATEDTATPDTETIQTFANEDIITINSDIKITKIN